MDFKNIKNNLFKGYFNSTVSVLLITGLLYVFYHLFLYFIVNGVWQGDADTCRASSGFCWSFIRAKFQYILVGLYPDDKLWRPALAFLLFAGFISYIKHPKHWHVKNFSYFGVILLLCAFLIRGGFFGLALVDSEQWGGLLLTIIVSVCGVVVAYPLGVLLALARRSSLPLLKYLSILYIEFIRGIPLISLLFMSAVLLPLFLPEGVEIGKLFRAQVAMIMFFSAYMAEIVRGGLQSIPNGQYEGAESLGLNYYQKMRKVVLPQALKVVIPPTVNTIIGFFKDTSLLVIIALFDLMYTAKAAVTDPSWVGFSVEAYLFIAAIYFILCFMMGKYAQYLETYLQRESLS
ncbi:MAG: amino acid ABC transporter permease [Bdellovibrionaceae bacterium]|nr:amino acid ABC transporter permease [Pseudobdellovibrionaceae bacterium]